jgi:N-acylneuraminate cytidylyltransferase/CMP-N,N'-diacetyllegionaminic acid synthase
MLAIIPARGGSKGLPGKNIKLLGGVPLICHTIKAALDSNLIDRVIVSTENDEIASIAKNCGAEVPFMRSIDLASDTSMVMDSYLQVVDMITKENSKLIESFVALLPTVPLRTSKDIDNAIQIFNDKNANSVISVVEASTPVYWHRSISKEGILENFLPEFNALKNRQELKKTYLPNGAVYVFRTEVLRSTREYYTSKTYPYIMPKERSADIDDNFDFEWARYLFKKNNKKGV